MNWTEQAEEMVKTWTDTQQKIWDSWMENMEKFSKPSQADEFWKKTVESWEGAVQNTLEAQSEWTRMWVESLEDTSGVPKETVEWAKQAQAMNKNWNEAQHQLWQSWFEMVKKIDPAKMDQSWDKEARKIFETWQESAQKLMEAQLSWAQKWGESQAKAKTTNSSK